MTQIIKILGTSLFYIVYSISAVNFGMYVERDQQYWKNNGQEK
jgi:hypothetical protein